MTLKSKIVAKLLAFAGIYHRPCDRILSASSTDGITWVKDNGVRIDVESGPNGDMIYYCHVVAVSNGYRMYYHRSIQRAGQWSGSILSAISSDGLSWEHEDGERIGLSTHPNLLHARSPNILTLSDGRLRMYYAGIDAKGQGNIFSAISTDGLHWNQEMGVRLSPEVYSNTDTLMDCHVIPIDGGYRLYTSAVRGKQSDIRSAISKDGLTWEKESGARIKCGVRGCMLAANNPCVVHGENDLLMYFRGGDKAALNNSIFLAQSTDGVYWKVSGPVLTPGKNKYERHGVAFPHILRLKDGTWRMYYTAYWGRHLGEAKTVSHWEKETILALRALKENTAH